LHDTVQHAIENNQNQHSHQTKHKSEPFSSNSSMALPNVFTSVPTIECWFAAKTAPRQVRAKNFQNCGDHSLYPCSYCSRKLDILNHDIKYLTKLCSREVRIFRGGNDWCRSLWHDLNGIRGFYKEQTANIRVHIDELVPSKAGANGHTGSDRAPGQDVLQKLKLRLEDMIREEGMEIEVGKAKGWI
jgi:hypothetical protein